MPTVPAQVASQPPPAHPRAGFRNCVVMVPRKPSWVLPQVANQPTNQPGGQLGWTFKRSSPAKNGGWELQSDFNALVHGGMFWTPETGEFWSSNTIKFPADVPIQSWRKNIEVVWSTKILGNDWGVRIETTNPKWERWWMSCHVFLMWDSLYIYICMYKYVYICIYIYSDSPHFIGRVMTNHWSLISGNLHTPVIIHFNWVFPAKPSSYWGIPMTMETPKWDCIYNHIDYDLQLLHHYEPLLGLVDYRSIDYGNLI